MPIECTEFTSIELSDGDWHECNDASWWIDYKACNGDITSPSCNGA